MLFLLSLALWFQISSQFGFAMSYPVFLKTELGYSATLAGVITGMFGIGQFIGRPVFGFISDKLGYRTTGIAGGIVMTISLILISGQQIFLRGLFTFQTALGCRGMERTWTFTGLFFQHCKGLALGLIKLLRMRSDPRPDKDR
jgi:MFS family permease